MISERGFDLSGQSYWDEGYENIELRIAPKRDQVRQWIETFIQPGGGDCLEIGCFPGRYLSVFGELGYELNGIDLTPHAEKEMISWLNRCGYKVGDFKKIDFFKYTPNKNFDIVCSFGFIEHFTNWDDALIKQALLVKDGGYLVVEVPNFRGFIQRLLHFFLDRENYNRHCIASMNPILWRNVIQKLDFDIMYCGYFSAFDFWVDNQKRNVIQKIFLRSILCLLPIFQKRLPKDKRIYAPFCGLIAKKRKHGINHENSPHC